MKSTLRLLAVPLAIGALAFAGCGSSDDSTDTTSNETQTTTTEAPAAAETVDVAADKDGALAYDPDKLTANAGDLTVKFTNDSALPHDIVFDGPDGSEVAKSSVFTGGSEDVNFKAEAGKYTFYCSVPGHREGGMEGTLEVK